MDAIVSVAANGAITVPINFVLWAFVVTYVIHILEESILPEVFVDKVKRLYWPEYGWTRFFWFNTLLLSLNISAVIVYETLGGSWIILPLSLSSERIWNGFYHLAETVRTKVFSSGLLSSVITWVLAYLVIRYSVMKGEISIGQFGLSICIGCVLFLVMVVPLVTGKLKSMK